MQREARWFIVTGLVLGVGGCSATEGRAPPSFPSPVQAARIATLPDAEISGAVTDSLARDGLVRAEDIHVNTSEGIVELRGTVGDLLSERRAVRIARTIKGVRGVTDQLVLAAPDFTDVQIARRVHRALLLDAVTDESTFGVKVHSGTVTLTGTVPGRYERTLAGRLAEQVSGVRALNNEVRVKRTILERSDEDLAARVRSGIAWDVYVPNEIDVHVENGKVTLDGVVGSEAERSHVLRDAHVEGARSVDGSGLLVSRRPSERRREAARPSDPQIAEAIHDAAIFDPRVESAGLHIAVRHGDVTLRGTVTDTEAKVAAEAVARDAVGVKKVRTDVQVVARNSISDTRVDGNVERALQQSPYTRSADIHVSTSGGRVTLSGTVGTALERAAAIDLAGSVKGVKEVESHLQTKRPEIAYSRQR